MTYTEDQVVEDEEDTEKEGGEGETELPATKSEGDSKDNGAMCFLLARSPNSIRRCYSAMNLSAFFEVRTTLSLVFCCQL